jgi:hypothetical protein
MVEFDLCLNGTTQMIKYNHNLDYRIKLVNDTTVRKTAKAYGEWYALTKAVVNHFIHNPDPMVVPVYSFEVISAPTTLLGSYEYSYDMMRLGMLDATEKAIIGHLASERYTKEINPFNDGREGYPLLVTFMNAVIEQNKYHDIHCGNIMKDLDEEYRLIDLESFWDGGCLNDPQYSWITR